MLSQNLEIEIISQLKNDEKVALLQLFKLYQNSLYHFASTFLDNKKQVEKIIANTFVKLWGKRNDFDNLTSIRAFLYTTVHMDCLTRLARIQSHLQDNNPNIFENVKYIEEKAVEAELLQAISEHLEHLSPIRKKIFKMTYFENLSPFEIVKKIKITIDSLRVQKVKMLNDLHTAIFKTRILLPESPINKESETSQNNEESILNEPIKQPYYSERFYNEILQSESFGKNITRMMHYDGKLIWRKIAHQTNTRSNSNSRKLQFVAVVIFFTIIAAAAYFSLSIFPGKPKLGSTNITPNKFIAGDSILKAKKDILKKSTPKNEIRKNRSIKKSLIDLKMDTVSNTEINDFDFSRNEPYNGIKTHADESFSFISEDSCVKIRLNPSSAIFFPSLFVEGQSFFKITGSVYFKTFACENEPLKIHKPQKTVLLEKSYTTIQPQPDIYYTPVKTKNGESFFTLRLADGTKVKLKEGSGIVIRSFDEKKKIVEIFGEISFEDAQSIDPPLTVISGFRNRHL